MTPAPWTAALDALERQLDRAEAELAVGGTELEIEPAPGGLGPLPVALGERATRLQLRLAGLESAVGHALEATRRALVLGDGTAAPAHAPRFLDARL